MVPGRGVAVLTRMLVLLLALTLLGCGDDPAGDVGEATAEEAAVQQLGVRPSTEGLVPEGGGSPPTRLVVEDLVDGEGATAAVGDVLVVHYVGLRWSDGGEFDASWTREQPFEFELGTGSVIEGWERGFDGMRSGGRRVLTIPPELAYGDRGAPPAIGPDESLVFVVDLVEIK